MSLRSTNILPVVLVDDEEEVLFGSSVLLKTFGISSVVTMSDGNDLLPYLERNACGVVVLDMLMPKISGLQLLPQIVQRYPEIPVVVMTAAQNVETAVTCMKEGAFDYLVKPVEESRFISSITRAMEIRTLRRQVTNLRDCLLGGQHDRGGAFSGIVTNHPKIDAIFQYILALSHSNEPVLITGETGVGKGLFGKAIHQASNRSGELITVNVAGLDDNMFSDSLFGHQRGAFSGADGLREGFVAKAENGTLFLDEIGDLTKSSQVKLLRLLQEKNYYPLGSDLPRLSNARIITATNQDLRHLIAENKFRKDLYFRLSGHWIEIPPLRERIEDIPLLMGFFLDEACKAMEKPDLEPPPELITLLSTYAFPGNVREMRSMIYDAVTRHKSGSIIGMKSFKKAMRANAINQHGNPDQVDKQIQSSLRTTGRFPTLKQAENLIIQEALRQTGGNQGIAALLLGVSRPALNRRLMRLKTEEVNS
ncbi:MAG: sigma-54-dependent Fis family transcriptional regulator [Magnetococcales bacterium]|nr:sigma-54-dependent Fis family transcriptional regulator [Magnetococcales bacterium]